MSDMRQIQLVSVVKGYEDHRTHVAKRGIVTWSDGRETFEFLPACGTRVDVSALERHKGTTVEVTCGRCEKTGLYANSAR